MGTNMLEYLRDLCQVIGEVSPRDAVGGLVVALALALAGSGACLLARKRTADSLPASCALILLISVGSMAFGFGHSRTRLGGSAVSLAEVGPTTGIPVRPEPIGRRLVDDADRDGDHRLTPEEAARFVKKADRAGKGWADASDIDRVLRIWVVPRPIQDFHPDTVRSGRPAWDD